jgi:hypothetical protein
LDNTLVKQALQSSVKNVIILLRKNQTKNKNKKMPEPVVTAQAVNKLHEYLGKNFLMEASLKEELKKAFPNLSPENQGKILGILEEMVPLQEEAINHIKETNPNFFEELKEFNDHLKKSALKDAEKRSEEEDKEKIQSLEKALNNL